jgi:outer membrane scaffolding protein for murein synthesis (MipA/OmpV family)
LAGQATPGPPPTPSWTFTFGAGGFVGPKYPGSDETRFLPLPIVGVDYKNRVFLGGSPSGVGAGLGVNLIRTDRLTVFTGLGGSEPRPEDRADALAGMEDRRLGFASISGLNYQLGPLQTGVAFSAGLRDNAGLSGTGTLGLTLPVTPRLFLTLGGNLTLANQDAMAFEFGVSPREGQRRSDLIAAGDPRLRSDEGGAYRPSGGVREVGASTSRAYLISRRWTLFGFGGATRLSDEAAKSPLVRRRTGWSGGAGFTVRP